MERLLTTVSCILGDAQLRGVIKKWLLRDRRSHTEDWVSPFGRSAGSDRARLYHDIAASEILEGLFSEERGDEREYHADTQLSSVYDEDAGVGPGRIETNVGETTFEGDEDPPFIPGHLRKAAV